MLKQVEKQRIADEIVDQLRSLILSGEYPPGSRLPAERELAKTLGVNRSSLREALQKLEHMGLLSIRQGDGTRVTHFMETASVELVQHLIPLADSNYPRIIRDALEFRLAYCREAARLAAARCTPDDIKKLRALAARCEPATDIKQLLVPVFEFFVAVAGASKNSVLSLLINSARNALTTHGPLLVLLLVSPEEIRRHQRAMIAALEAGDVKAAVAEATEHVERGNRHATQLLESQSIKLPPY